jgi:hypothetical protein
MVTRFSGPCTGETVLAGHRKDGRLPPIDQYIVMVTDDDGGTRQLDVSYHV